MLNPKDWESIGTFHNLLSLELQSYLSYKTQRKNFTLVGLPFIIIEKSNRVPAGNVEIETFFKKPMEYNGVNKINLARTKQNTKKV